jgi:Calcineurin-like phosphoesterase
MIDKVLQRSYVVSRAERLAENEADPVATPPEDLIADPAELEAELGGSPSDEEVEAAMEDLAAAAKAAAKEPLTPAPIGGGRRGKQPTAIEERSYFPRDALTSIAQSVLEIYLREHRQELLRPVVPAKGGLRGNGGDPVVDYVLEIPDTPHPDENRRLAGAYEVTDPGWLRSVFAMGWRALRGRHKFKNEPATPRALDDHARVLLVGDWASGHSRAQKVATAMRTHIEDAAAAGREVHVIHLGDTYYGGFKVEYEMNFLPYWPVRTGEPHCSWSCNGNHDMRSSWFSLENDHWQLLGLDTSHEEHALKDPQAKWVADKRAEFPNRKTMLLSHHQLFSEYGDDGPKIEAKLGAHLHDHPVEAWFWGHEHKFVKFANGHRNVAVARCIGHGGIPVYADRRPIRFPATWRETNYIESLGGLEKWSLFGFAVLDFRDTAVDVRYFNEWGTELADQKETIG